MKRLFFLTISFFMFSFIFIGMGKPARAETVSDREEALLHMGPEEVGYTSITITDPTRNRTLNLMIWFPTKEVGSLSAVYNVILGAPTFFLNPSSGAGICLPPTPTPPNTLCTVCLPPLCNSPLEFSADDYASAVEGKKVSQGVSVAPGAHPVVIKFPAGVAAAVLFIYEGVKYASHGFIFVGMNSPNPSDRRQADLDAKFVLDTLENWNQTQGHLLYAAIDPVWKFGTGHSAGGRTALEITSPAPTDPLSPQFGLSFIPELRLKGLAVQDATREVPVALQAIWKEQLAGNYTDILLNSQACRDTQFALQQDLGNPPQMLAVDRFCRAVPGLDHNLFSQACMFVAANLDAGNPINWLLPDIVAACTLPNPCSSVAELKAHEAFVAQQTTKFNIAFFKTLMRENQYRVLFAPGQVLDDEGVSLINASLGEGGDETNVLNANIVGGAEGFCIQPGEQDLGGSPIMSWDEVPL